MAEATTFGQKFGSCLTLILLHKILYFYCSKWSVSFNNNLRESPIEITTMFQYYRSANDAKVAATDFDVILLRMNKPIRKYGLMIRPCQAP